MRTIFLLFIFGFAGVTAGCGRSDPPPPAATRQAAQAPAEPPKAAFQKTETQAIAEVELLKATVKRDKTAPGEPVTEVVFEHKKSVKDAAVQNVKAFAELRLLNLANTGVTDAGLESIKSLNHLQTLFLAGTGITDAGLASLADLNELKTLSLIGDAITDDGLEHLHKLKSLRHLFLARTQVTDEGVRKLQQELSDCNITQ